MPNYFVTNTARFNPFTYQELYKTAADITQQHYALEEALANIDDGTLSTYLAGEDRESPYIRGYNDLNSRTQALSEQLAANGISPNLMRDAIRLKNDYKKFAVPVEAAGKRKLADVSAYNKMYASDPSLIGDNPNEKNLQWYIENPNYSPQYTSAKSLMSLGAAAGESFAADFTPQYRLTQNGKFYEVQTRQTAGLEDIQTKPQFRKAIDDILRMQGFDPESGDVLTQKARAAAEFGMANSMQDRGLKQQGNPGYITPERVTRAALDEDTIVEYVGSKPFVRTVTRDANGKVSYGERRLPTEDEYSRISAGTHSQSSTPFPLSDGSYVIVDKKNNILRQINPDGTLGKPATQEQVDEYNKIKLGSSPKEDLKGGIIGGVSGDGKDVKDIEGLENKLKGGYNITLTKIPFSEVQKSPVVGNTKIKFTDSDDHIFVKDSSGNIYQLDRETLQKLYNSSKKKGEVFKNFDPSDFGIEDLSL